MRRSFAMAMAICIAGAIASARPVYAAPRGTYIVVEPGAPTRSSPQDLAAAAAPRIFYLNRKGGTYTPGNSDARTNRSSIAKRASTIPAWQISDANWATVVSCVKDQFARWNVVVTDVDPGNTPHLESVIAGSPEDIDQPAGVGGVSPFALDCSTINNSIVFTFAEVFGTSYRTVCEVAAQEMAHSFGLDHERLCEDPMTYLDGCGKKSFQDKAVRCGEFEDRDCACGDATQNSVSLLTARLGLAVPNQPPTVAITAPADGASVTASVAVAVTASDDKAVTRVELWIDGAARGSDDSAPYQLAASGLAAGSRTLEVRAFDAEGTSATDRVTITVGADSGGTVDAGPGGGGGGHVDAGPGGGGNPGAVTTDGVVTGGCDTGEEGRGPGGPGLLLVGIGAWTMARRPRRRRRSSPAAR